MAASNVFKPFIEASDCLGLQFTSLPNSTHKFGKSLAKSARKGELSLFGIKIKVSR